MQSLTKQQSLFWLIRVTESIQTSIGAHKHHPLPVPTDSSHLNPWLEKGKWFTSLWKINTSQGRKLVFLFVWNECFCLLCKKCRTHSSNWMNCLLSMMPYGGKGGSCVDTRNWTFCLVDPSGNTAIYWLDVFIQLGKQSRSSDMLPASAVAGYWMN